MIERLEEKDIEYIDNGGTAVFPGEHSGLRQ